MKCLVSNYDPDNLVNPFAKMHPHVFHSPAHGAFAGPVGACEHSQALNGF